jgi:tRNA splicing endonuclease
MKQNLIKKLHAYIRENNPDLLFELEESDKVNEYLFNKINTVSGLIKQLDIGEPAYIIEDACMDVLTKDFRPSKFNYISNLLEEEFESTYNQILESGLIKFEIVNMIIQCQSVFDDLNFSEENEDNQFLRYAIIGTIKEYLEDVTSENENVKDGLQQSTKTEG